VISFALATASDVVIWAARRAMGAAANPMPRPAEAAEWNRVVDFAGRNGVIPLAAGTLRGDDSVPFAVRRDMDKRHLAGAGWNAILAREMLGILADFRSAGIDVLAYKGPALAMLAYGDLAARHASSDIDLLLRRSALARAGEALRERGYRSSLSAAEERHFLRHRYHLHFRRRSPDVQVELHWALTPSYWSFPLDCWRHAKTVVVSGSPVPTLDPEGALLALCAHGAKEGWPRLIQILDVGQLIVRHPQLDWDRVFHSAERMRRQRILRLGLLLANQCIGAPLPRLALSEVGKEPDLEPLAQRLERNLGQGFFAKGFHEYALKVWNRPLDRLRYVAYELGELPGRVRDLAAPSQEDRKAVELRGPFAALYPVIRPFRALRQHGLRHVVRQVRGNLWT